MTPTYYSAPVTRALFCLVVFAGEWITYTSAHGYYSNIIPESQNKRYNTNDPSYNNRHSSRGSHGNSLQTNELPSQSSKDKVLNLGSVLKKHVHELRQTTNRQVDLVFLVDSSASVGADNFNNELKFVRKLLADFTVDRNSTRVAVITFSSPSRVVREVDQISQPDNKHHKCSILEEELPAIQYTGGGTFTLGAMEEAQVSPARMY